MRQNRYIGKCIYCGATDDLSREHIVPLGLNGEWTLSKASCKTCREVTGRFEDDVLRKAFGWARTALGMRTRHPHERPKTLRLGVGRGGVETEVLVDVHEHPTFMHLPQFTPPGAGASGGMTVVGPGWIRQITGPPIGEALRRVAGESGCDYVMSEVDYAPVAFGRELAKIAYGFAVLGLGHERIREAYVLPAILGDTTNLSKWVGSRTGTPLLPTTGLHAIRLEQRGHELHAFVRLFAQFGAPEYHVIVGTVRDLP